MVNTALSVGGLAGVLLSGGFIYWQIGRYAAPQVPETLFEERRLFIAYAVGLFVGAPLILPFLFYLSALRNGALDVALLDLFLLLAGTEAAAYLTRRARYFGRDAAGPFYALSLRAGAAGILTVALVTGAFSPSAPQLAEIPVVFAQAVAIIAVSTAAGYLAIRLPDRRGLLAGSPIGAALFAVFGYALIGGAEVLDPATGFASAALAVAGSTWVIFRLRDTVLGRIPPPSGVVPKTASPSAYGRLERRSEPE
ncbi:MAG: hypothetical protein L3K07_04925 [Thermoplasmata archaeon]|nr:hypothetical protein [Thermoplasmata archaeon]